MAHRSIFLHPRTFVYDSDSIYFVLHRQVRYQRNYLEVDALCGFVNFMVGPSNSLPNSVVIMGFGQFLNSGLEVYFMTTCLPVMIKEGEKMYNNNKLEVADKASGMVNWMFDLGQAFGLIYGSYMAAYFGFRNTADSIAFMLIAYSIIYFFVVKCFDMSRLTQENIEIDVENKQGNK